MVQNQTYLGRSLFSHLTGEQRGPLPDARHDGWTDVDRADHSRPSAASDDGSSHPPDRCRRRRTSASVALAGQEAQDERQVKESCSGGDCGCCCGCRRRIGRSHGSLQQQRGLNEDGIGAGGIDMGRKRRASRLELFQSGDLQRYPQTLSMP